MTLVERFRFYKERNDAPLAYYFARRKHAPGYSVPEFLVTAWIGGKPARGCFRWALELKEAA